MSECGPFYPLHLFTNERLVKFVQKIGYYQAARIIEERKINGSKILELTERDTLKWHLTEVEEELLWKCIHQLKLNHLIVKRSQPPRMNPKRKESFKYLKNSPWHSKQNDMRKLISSMENMSDTSEEYYTEYIFGPVKKNIDNALQFKTTQLRFRNSDQFSSYSDDSYLTAIDDESETYESVLLATRRQSNLNENSRNKVVPKGNCSVAKQSSGLEKKKKGFKLQFKLKLSCFSGGIACIGESLYD